MKNLLCKGSQSSMCFTKHSDGQCLLVVSAEVDGASRPEWVGRGAVSSPCGPWVDAAGTHSLTHLDRRFPVPGGLCLLPVLWHRGHRGGSLNGGGWRFSDVPLPARCKSTADDEQRADPWPPTSWCVSLVTQQLFGVSYGLHYKQCSLWFIPAVLICRILSVRLRKGVYTWSRTTDTVDWD